MELTQNLTVKVKTDGAPSVDALSQSLDTLNVNASDLGSSLSGKVRSGFDSLKGSLGSLAGPLSNLTGMLAGGAVVAGIAAMGKRAIDSADSLGKLSQKLGVSTEDLSKLGHAATLSGS